MYITVYARLESLLSCVIHALFDGRSVKNAFLGDPYMKPVAKICAHSALS